MLALAYALENPEKVRSIIFMNASLGLQEEMNFPALVQDFVKDYAKHFKESGEVAKKGGVKKLLKHPGWALKAASAIGKTADITDLLSSLHEQGIDLRIIQAKQNRADEVWERIEKKLGIEPATVSFFADPTAWHNTPLLDERFAKAVGQILDDIDKKDSMKKAEEGPHAAE